MSETVHLRHVVGTVLFPIRKILLWNSGPREHSGGWALFFNDLCSASRSLGLSVFLTLSLHVSGKHSNRSGSSSQGYHLLCDFSGYYIFEQPLLCAENQNPRVDLTFIKHIRSARPTV